MVTVWLQLSSAALEEALAEALRARGLEVAEAPLAAQVGLVAAEGEVPVPPPLPSVVLLRTKDQASQAMKKGYKGYLYPEQGLEVLLRALKAVARGEAWAERRLVAEVLGGNPFPLTPREREVAVLAAQGLSNEEIARRLGISVKTVKAHLSLVFQKLGVKRRSELAYLRFLP